MALIIDYPGVLLNNITPNNSSFDLSLAGGTPLTDNLAYDDNNSILPNISYGTPAPIELSLIGGGTPLTDNLGFITSSTGVLESKSSGDGSGPAPEVPIGQYWG